MASKCFDGNLYCYKKIRYFVRKSQIFDKLQLKQVSLSAAKFWQINSAQYNLKSGARHFFLNKVYFFKNQKSKRNIQLLHAYIYLGVVPSYKHFTVSPAACVINSHLEHSFYIHISKNIISYFNTMKMLFAILLPISCKK